MEQAFCFANSIPVVLYWNGNQVPYRDMLSFNVTTDGVLSIPKGSLQDYIDNNWTDNWLTERTE